MEITKGLPRAILVANMAKCILVEAEKWMDSEDMGKTCVGTTLLRSLVPKRGQRNEEVLGELWAVELLEALLPPQPGPWAAFSVVPWLPLLMAGCLFPPSIVNLGLAPLGKSHHLFTESCNQTLKSWWSYKSSLKVLPRNVCFLNGVSLLRGDLLSPQSCLCPFAGELASAY